MTTKHRRASGTKRVRIILVRSIDNKIVLNILRRCGHRCGGYETTAGLPGGFVNIPLTRLHLREPLIRRPLNTSMCAHILSPANLYPVGPDLPGSKGHLCLAALSGHVLRHLHSSAQGRLSSLLFCVQGLSPLSVGVVRELPATVNSNSHMTQRVGSALVCML